MTRSRRPGWLACTAAWFVVASLRAPAEEFSLPAHVEQFALEHPADQPVRPVVVDLAVCDAREAFASAGDDGKIRLWNAANGTILRTLDGRCDWIRSIDFHPRGELLASGGDDGRLVLWNAEQGRAIAQWNVASGVFSVRFSPDGRWLAAAGFGGECLIVDAERRVVVQRLQCPCQDVRAIAFSPSSQVLAAAGRNGRIRLWDVATGDQVAEFKGDTRRIRCLTFADQETLLAAGDSGDVSEWDVVSRTQTRSWPTGQGRIYCMTLLSDETVATGGSDNSVRFWSRGEGVAVGVLYDAQGTVADLEYRPSTGELLGCGFDAEVRLWRLKPNGVGSPQAAARSLR